MSKKQSSAAPRRHYDDQFKQESVKLATTGKRSVPDVAKSLGISTNILYRWRDLAQASNVQAPCQAELAQLREQLRRAEQERDILKKHCPFSADRPNPALRICGAVGRSISG